jgi:hypothetical protein
MKSFSLLRKCADERKVIRMPREVIEGRALVDCPEVDDLTDYLRGANVRLLSCDDVDGAFSAYVRAPIDLAFDFPGGRTLEMFVLSGSLEVNQQRVPSGQYVYLPPQGGGRHVRIAEGATLFFATGELGLGSGEFEIIDPESKPWQVRTSECKISSTGISTNVVKHLRVDQQNRNNFGIDVMWPGGGLDCTEWHTVADEIFRLSGDLLLLDPVTGQPVEAGPGSYAWRPSMSRHLPKYSHTGCVQIFRNREWPKGEGEMVYAPAPGWGDHLSAYKKKFPLIGPIPGL